MTSSKDFAQFIDELRDSRNITKKDFAENIVSLRQYYRFIKGEYSLKSESINALLDKLEINTIQAYESFRKKRNNNYSMLSDVYVNLYNNNLKDANKLFKKIEKDSISTSYNKKYYSLIETLLEIYQEKTLKKTGMKKILTILDYPKIMEKDVLSFVEITGLLFVSDYLLKNDDFRLAAFSYELISSQEDTSKKKINDYSFPFYITTSRNLGIIGKTEQSLIVANKGISLYENHKGFNLFASLLYYKALDEKVLFEDSRYKDTLRKLFAILYVQSNTKIREDIGKSIYKNFGIREHELIEYK
jgi:transcriptional regulator with XRE-family HTH domain